MTKKDKTEAAKILLREGWTIDEVNEVLNSEEKVIIKREDHHHWHYYQPPWQVPLIITDAPGIEPLFTITSTTTDGYICTSTGAYWNE